VLARTGVREGGAGVVGGIADRDHVVEAFVDEAIERLARLRRGVDADLFERLQRERSHQCLLRAGALHLDASAGARPKERLCHLRPCRVVRTEEEDPWCSHEEMITPQVNRG